MKKNRKGVYEILFINLHNPSACKTINGIGIGDTKSTLIKIMGEPIDSWYNDNQGVIIYKGIRFSLKQNLVHEFIIDEISIIPQH